MADIGSFGLFLLVAGDYPDPPGHLPSSDSADRLTRLIAGGRGGTVVRRAIVDSAAELRDFFDRWAAHTEEGPASSFVYYAGHGSTDGESHWLVLPQSGGTPTIAKAVRTSELGDVLMTDWLHRQSDPSSWAVVVLDCCASDVGVTNLMNRLTEAAYRRPRHLGLWPVTPQGASHSGRFVEALERALETFTENDARIPLQELIRRVAPELGDLEPQGFLPDGAALTNPIRAAETLTMTVDAHTELRRLIGDLPTEVRSHFLAKAQGAEVGELAWHFCGREDELASLSTWLGQAPGGLRVVTGAAGSGKSALLGHLVVLADDGLVGALRRSRVAPQLGTGVRPPAQVFDAVVHLTGKTLAQVARELAAGTGILEPDEGSVDADAVVSRLGKAGRRLTILADALDEAQDPMSVAGFLLRVGEVPGVRTLVGTRHSMHEAVDRPFDPKRRDLLDRLGAQDQDLVVLGVDRAVNAEYVRRRLLAEGSPYAGDMHTIDRIAELIAGLEHPVLFARLVTAELLARPAMDPGDPAFGTLLRGGHRGVFAAAVARLEERSPAVGACLQALAFARGRGLPETAGIWVTVARALRPGARITDSDVRVTLDAAAPYVTLDGEGGQTTYRLAHQTFVEHFLSSVDRAAVDRAIGVALLDAVRRSGGWDDANHYLVRYLFDHLAAAPHEIRIVALDATFLRRALALLGVDQMTEVLAAARDRAPSLALDALSGAVVGARVALARDPSQLVAQLHARLHDEADDELRRLVSTLPAVGPPVWLRARTAWLGWRSRLQTIQTLPAKVRWVAPAKVEGGSMLAVATGDEVHLWDPRSGVTQPWVSNEGLRITAVAGGEPSGRPAVAVAAGYDGRLVVRSADSGNPLGPPIACGVTNSLALGRLRDRDVVVAVADGTALAWDVHSGQEVDVPQPHAAPLAVADTSTGLVLVAEGGDVSDLATGSVLGTGVPTGELNLTALGEAGDRLVVCAGRRDGTALLWDVAARRELGRVDLQYAIRSIAFVEVGGDILVAAADESDADYGLVILGDPRAPVRAAQTGTVLGVAAAGEGVVAVVEEGGGLHMLDPISGRRSPADDSSLVSAALGWAENGEGPHPSVVVPEALARARSGTWPVVSAGFGLLDGRRVLAVGSLRGGVWIHDVEAGGDSSPLPSLVLLFRGKAGPRAGGRFPGYMKPPLAVTGVAMGTIGDTPVLARACEGRVDVWDMRTWTDVTPPDLPQRRAASVALGRLTGRSVLVTGGEGGVLSAWDPDRRAPLASITVDAGIRGVWVVPRAETIVALTHDGSIHVFDVVAGTEDATP